jgi:aminoglycoside phosphotransferase (APT) family kinase protein
MGLTWLPGSLSRAEVAARWSARSGRSVTSSELLFYFVLASFKVAVIAQQIYARYARGFTTVERFALLGLAVAVIAARTVRALDAGHINPT